jgi:hypothetical protein
MNLKKLVTAVGALLALLSVFSTWLIYNQHMPVSKYDMAGVAPGLFYTIAAIGLIALILLILPLFLSDPSRMIVVVLLSIAGFGLLYMFSAGKDVVAQGYGTVDLTTGWYLALTGLIIALAGSFVGGKKRVLDE